MEGHVVLVDFGLAAHFPDSKGPGAIGPVWMKGSPTSRPGLARHVTDGAKLATDTCDSFVGTAEYLAPEVIQGLPYSYEVDW